MTFGYVLEGSPGGWRSVDVGLLRSGTLLELPRELGLRGVTELCELGRLADEALTKYPLGKSS